MKRTAYIIALFACAASFQACVEEYGGSGATGSGAEGAAALTFRMPSSTRAADADAYPWKEDCEIRIYKKTEALGKELIRHYFSLRDMPEQIWLLEGSYSVTAALGSKDPATFDRPSYYGEAGFEIEAGKSTDVAVQCNLLNTIVEVVFDESVTNTFDTGLRVIATVGDSVDDDSAADGEDTLIYTSTKKGYFMLPDDASAISFCFLGHSSDPDVKERNGADGEIHRHITKNIEAGKTAGYLYRLNFTYSPDPEGHLSWDFDVTCDTSAEESEEFFPVNPAPKPTITGDGWDIDSAAYASDELRYTVSFPKSVLKSIKIESGEHSFEIDSETVSYAGIEIERTGETLAEVTVILKKEFFDNFTGGEHVLAFTATAKNDSENTVYSTVIMQGAYALTPTDEWNAEGEFSAYVLKAGASDVKIRYRVSDSGSWSESTAHSESDNIWKAAGTSINAKTEYEYRLVIDGQETGAVNRTVTDDGPQVYNSDFEIWTTQGKVLCPYIDLNTDQWWDSGNHGSSSFLGNITTNEMKDLPPYTSGKTSAKLSSAKVSILTLNVLAAGNIYLGKFVTTKNTTKGVVRFGHSFDFTYRPKALQFWYKGVVGNVDVFTSGTPEIQNGGKDKQQIYILLCDMPGPHIVDTSDPDSFLNVTNGMEEISYYSGDISAITANNCSNDATGKVIAWGVWENDTTVDDWMLKTITLNYTKYADIKPQWLMITACANKYGDYYSGCSGNVIQLDDMELVY